MGVSNCAPKYCKAEPIGPNDGAEGFSRPATVAGSSPLAGSSSPVKRGDLQLEEAPRTTGLTPAEERKIKRRIRIVFGLIALGLMLVGFLLLARHDANLMIALSDCRDRELWAAGLRWIE